MRTNKLVIDCILNGQDGADWYRQAKLDIESCTDALRTDRETLAAALAIFSPRCHVNRSIHYAVNAIRHCHGGEGSMLQRNQAWWKYIDDGVVRGPKVNPFYHALLGDESAVVVDTWISKVYQKDFSKLKNRERIAIQRSIRMHAQKAGETPAATQAMIWVGFRRLCRHPRPVENLDVSGYVMQLPPAYV